MPFLVLEIADFICVERDSVESRIILKSLCSSSFFTCRGEKLVKITSTSFFTLAFAKFANFVWISQMTTMFIIQTVPVSTQKPELVVVTNIVIVVLI